MFRAYAVNVKNIKIMPFEFEFEFLFFVIAHQDRAWQSTRIESINQILTLVFDDDECAMLFI